MKTTWRKVKSGLQKDVKRMRNVTYESKYKVECSENKNGRITPGWLKTLILEWRVINDYNVGADGWNKILGST